MPRLTGLKRIELTKGGLILEMPGCIEASMFADFIWRNLPDTV